jgi:hypothetical protein
VSHKNADRLSRAIDAYLSGDVPTDADHLGDVFDALAAGFPEVTHEDARERVRRRLAGVTPSPKSPQVLLVERAAEELDLLRRRFIADEYVPWPTLVGGAAVAVAAIGLAIWLRRRGIGSEALPEA